MLRSATAQQEETSPSDLANGANTLAPVPIKDDGGKSSKGCDDTCGKGSKGSKCRTSCLSALGSRLACMCEGEPWSLWESIAPCAAANSCIEVGGWTQIGYHTQGAYGDGTAMFKMNGSAAVRSRCMARSCSAAAGSG